MVQPLSSVLSKCGIKRAASLEVYTKDGHCTVVWFLWSEGM
jgi:hypothetical protein